MSNRNRRLIEWNRFEFLGSMESKEDSHRTGGLERGREAIPSEENDTVYCDVVKKISFSNPQEKSDDVR